MAGVVEVGGRGAGFVGVGRRDTGIQVTLPNIPLWLPVKAQQLLMTLTRNTLHLALQTVAGAVSNEAPVDTGILAQSFGADPATQEGGIEMLGVTLTEASGRVFSSLPHAIVMDQGRRPGQPISREGIDAIGLWAQRKLGMSADEASSAKWAIAQSIIDQGIEGRYYFQAGVDAARPTVEQMFQALVQEVGKQLTTVQR
jgi:hypothetical protein